MSTDAPASWILELRARLESPPPRRLPARDVRRAAVLVPLYVDAGQLWVLLTRRTDHLPTHKSQIAFPGGGLELGEDPWAAAVRESHEEIGLDPAKVLRLGMLDEASTPSGFHIIPCVGAVPHPVETRLNEEEIAEVFTVPLTALATPRLVEQRRVEIDGVPREITVFHVGRHRIWGLTARILLNLLERLGIAPADEGLSEPPWEPGG
jgi:8-oxo-dGTP pyrophosphatase MutT (NUDIX family)